MDDVKEHVDCWLCRSRLVREHVTQKSKCALVDLTSTSILVQHYFYRVFKLRKLNGIVFTAILLYRGNHKSAITANCWSLYSLAYTYYIYY